MIVQLDKELKVDISVGVYARKQAWIGDDQIELEMSGGFVTVTSDQFTKDFNKARTVGLMTVRQIGFTQNNNSLTFRIADVVH